VTLDEFHVGMSRLEKMFNGCLELGTEVRDEYYQALQYVRGVVFRDAVQYVVETFKPFPSEPFPSVATIEDAIVRTRESAGEEAGWDTRRQAPPDNRVLDYCQRCDNIGLYLGDDGLAHICVCEKGRLKRASWGVEAFARKREEKIQKALAKIPPSSGPVCGLREWNPLGFWEDTQEEHDRWKAAKLAQIEILKCRVTPTSGKSAVSDELRFKEIKEAAARVKVQDRFPAPATREPGEDIEEDEPPF
jgi:hypothetical protein